MAARTAWGLLLLSSLCLAGDASPPADIQSIMDKAMGGQKPSQADMQKLHDWQKSNKKKSPVPDPIPVSITGFLDYTRKREDSGKDDTTVQSEHVRIDWAAEGSLTVIRNLGNEDAALEQKIAMEQHKTPLISHFAISTDPSKPSHFDLSGEGTLKNKAFDIQWKGTMKGKAAFAVDLLTTGTDRLFPRGAVSPTAFQLQWNKQGSYWKCKKANSGCGWADIKELNQPLDGTSDWDLFQHKAPDPDKTRTEPVGEQYLVSPFGWEMGHGKFPVMGQPSIQPRINLSYKELARILASGGSGTIQGDESFDAVDGDGVLFGRSGVRINIRPPKLEAILLPVSTEEYRKWVPEGPKPSSGGGPGNRLAVRVELRTSDKHARVQQPFKTRFNLRDTSHLKGYCTNYPQQKFANADEWLKPDLRFVAASNPEGSTIENDEQQLTTPDGHGMDGAVVTSFDYGGYSSLQATATLEDGTELDAKVDPDVVSISGKDDALTIPADKDGNHVADAWEKQQGVSGKQANWDEDAKPPGQARNGDGYTLFEEYRGFVEIKGGDKSWSRFDPNEKDVFAYDPDALHAKYYMPDNPSELNWHYLDQTMMAANTSNLLDPNARWVNTNTGENSDRFYARQYAIWVKADYANLNVDYAGTSLSLNDIRQKHGKPPLEGFNAFPSCKNAIAAEIEISRIVGAYRPVDPKSLRDKIIETQIKVTVVHEVGHMLEITHHDPVTGGDPKCSIRYLTDDQTQDVNWLQVKAYDYCGRCFKLIDPKCDP